MLMRVTPVKNRKIIWKSLGGLCPSAATRIFWPNWRHPSRNNRHIGCLRLWHLSNIQWLLWWMMSSWPLQYGGQLTYSGPYKQSLMRHLRVYIYGRNALTNFSMSFHPNIIYISLSIYSFNKKCITHCLGSMSAFPQQGNGLLDLE